MRGDRLNLTVSEISQGFAYPGRLAVQYGLIDKLASQADAVAEAARQAGLDEYDVIDLEKIVVDRILASRANGSPVASPSKLVLSPSEETGAPTAPLSESGDSSLGSGIPWFFKPWLGAADPLTGQRNLPPGIYLLYDVRLGGEK
jgi:hypothetical protein